MRALVPVLAIAVIAVAVVLVVAIRSRVERAKQTRAELARHEKFLHHLHKQALRDAQVDPTSYAFADELTKHLSPNEESS